jgi:ubiquinone/menaquinone biosynthesis C-methylase UbiE
LKQGLGGLKISINILGARRIMPKIGFWKAFWIDRRENWIKSYAETKNHKHRDKIIKILKKWKFDSLLEVGCNAAPNLKRIEEEFPDVKLAGIDISEGSIETAKKLIPKAELYTGVAEKLPFADKSFDVILSDAVMFYLDYFEIEAAMKEIKRVGKKYLLMVELQQYGNKNIGSYFGRNYEELLKDFNFKDIKLVKMPKKDWDSTVWQEHGYYITAKI